LQWATEEGCPWNELITSLPAQAGHLHILKWLFEQKLREASWHGRTSYVAAQAGHSDLLQWAIRAGCPWHEQACAAAAGAGHFEAVKWMHGASTHAIFCCL